MTFCLSRSASRSRYGRCGHQPSAMPKARHILSTSTTNAELRSAGSNIESISLSRSPDMFRSSSTSTEKYDGRTRLLRRMPHSPLHRHQCLLPRQSAETRLSQCAWTSSKGASQDLHTTRTACAPQPPCTARRTWSIAARSSTVDRSPGSSPRIVARTARRTILPERVFGRNGTAKTRSARNALPS
jgi:hypothetical protein